MKYENEWNEAIRLLHKFCPESKSLIHTRRDFNLDSVLTVMRWVGLDISSRVLFDQKMDSLPLIKKYFDSHFKYEQGRVLVISDAGDYPFVCSIHKLYERVAEGVKSEWRGDEYFPCYCYNGNLRASRSIIYMCTSHSVQDLFL